MQVPPGSQQSSAIMAIEDHFLRLAQIVEERCADSRSKSVAQTLLFQAKLLAVHAISHR